MRLRGRLRGIERAVSGTILQATPAARRIVWAAGITPRDEEVQRTWPIDWEMLEAMGCIDGRR